MSFNRPGDECWYMSIPHINAPEAEFFELVDEERGPDGKPPSCNDSQTSIGGVSSSARTVSSGLVVSSRGGLSALGSYSSRSMGGGFGSSLGNGFNVHFVGGAGESSSFFGGNDKQTMQNLNHRLANYLDKVRSLEESNTELEHKIREWHEKQAVSGATATQCDYDHYYKTIDELRGEILKSYCGKSQAYMEVDSFRLAARDFRLMYENEKAMRQKMEANINGLSRALDEVTMSSSDLVMQIDSLADELADLKKNHEEEMGEMRTQMTGQISVEMDAAPGIDLTKILAEMREQYEMMANKNRREAEVRFIASSKKLQKDVMANVERMQSGKSEITELRRILQGLEIELQSQFSMKISLKDLLSETEYRYGSQLLQIQSAITGYEAQLKGLRSDRGHQNHQYKMLLDVKNRLEMEIGMYRKLLENPLDGQRQL